jgi:hypothetical protein
VLLVEERMVITDIVITEKIITEIAVLLVSYCHH